INPTVRDGLAVLLFAALMPLAFLFQSRHRLDKAIGELSYPIYICHSLVILFFSWLLNDVEMHQPMLFSALVIAGCIGFSALLNGLVADPVERLRSRLRRKPLAGEDVATDAQRRPQSAAPPSPAQPMGSIHRVP
ncbi:MAG: acyltransferase, partial [Achromobacter sp.]|nr:acyltransferase [Achromobacter sp.]